MNWAEFNWLNWGYVMWALTWGTLLFYASRRRWTRLGLFIGIANMVLVSLNEYVTIPSYLAFPLMLGLMVVPFALAVPWGLKRAK